MYFGSTVGCGTAIVVKNRNICCKAFKKAKIGKNIGK
jgi:hypothetical protein